MVVRNHFEREQISAAPSLLRSYLNHLCSLWHIQANGARRTRGRCFESDVEDSQNRLMQGHLGERTISLAPAKQGETTRNGCRLRVQKRGGSGWALVVRRMGERAQPRPRSAFQLDEGRGANVDVDEVEDRRRSVAVHVVYGSSWTA